MENETETEVKRVSFLRHAAWFSPEFVRKPLNVIGCGAMGSHIALSAAKMGVHNFHLWDMDHVEAHNLPNQAFDLQHIGKLKVEALAEVLTRFNPAIKVTVHPTPFAAADAALLDGPVILAVDSNKVRRLVVDETLLNPKVDKIFETRLGFDYGEVNVLDNMSPTQVKRFNEALLDDDKVPEGPCNLRICTTLVGMVSSWAVHTLCDYYATLARQEQWKGAGRKYIFSTDKGLSTFTM